MLNKREEAFKATEYGDIDTLRRLTDEFPSLLKERDERGRTLLHIAAYAAGDQADIVLMLLSKGANQNAIDNDGWTAADWADYAVHNDVLLILGGPGILASEKSFFIHDSYLKKLLHIKKTPTE